MLERTQNSFQGVLELEMDFSNLLGELVEFYDRHRRFGVNGQLSLKNRPGHPLWTDGVGSLYDRQEARFIGEERDFTEMNPQLPPRISNLFSDIENWTLQNVDHKIGRIRFISLASKTCLSYHRDTEILRFHIPLLTNEKCFFVIDDQVHRMPSPGRAYLMRTDLFHTAINANLEFERLHLVFSTYKVSSHD